MGKQAEKMVAAESVMFPDADNTFILPLDMLDPIDKIREPAMYEAVKRSFVTSGHVLLYPLIIHPLTREDWWKEMELNVDALPPPDDGPVLRYRIQCGCNRYFMLKELGYDAVSCQVFDNLHEAEQQCRLRRRDKSWYRGVQR